MARKDGRPRTLPHVAPVPHPPVSDISPRARVIAKQTGVSEVAAQRGLDRGWLR